MTLLVALKGSDGIVMAADSRGTFGDPRGVTAQNDQQLKAHILSPHVAVLSAGSGEVGAMVIHLVKQRLAAQPVDGVTEVMNILRDTVREQYQNWFPSIPAIPPLAMVQAGQMMARPELAFIVGGYEAAGNAEQRLFGLSSFLDFSPMLHDYGFAVQGIAQYALYLLNRMYQSDRSVQELVPLASYVITETANQDGKVGGPVKVITIKHGNEGCQELPKASIDQIQLANASRSDALRSSFYERGGNQ